MPQVLAELENISFEKHPLIFKFPIDGELTSILHKFKITSHTFNLVYSWS